MRQFTKHAASLFAVTIACGLSTQTASAQFSSTSRTGSASGNALTGSGLGGSTSGLGASAQGQGLGGAAGQANAGANRTAGTGQSALGQSLLNQNNAQNGFVGGRNQQQQFIGGNQRTNQNTRQQQNQFGNQGRQNQNDQNGMNQQGQNNNQRRAIRPQQKVAFEIPQRTETEIRTTLQTRFDGLAQTPALRGVAFEMDSDGIVTLRGEVATTSARQLAANLVRLEPGVRKVVNELTVP